MLGEFVVLLLLEIRVVDGGSQLSGGRFPYPAKQVLDDRLIVEETMNIGADAVVGLQNGLVRIADALMNLVALTLLTFELEGYLLGGFLMSHGRMDRQQAKTGQAGNGTLDAVGVADGLSFSHFSSWRLAMALNGHGEMNASVVSLVIAI